MTCKDCVKYDACLAYNGGMTRLISMKNKAEEKCGHFKNKSDFVEVVRCKDCKERLSYDDWDRNRQTSYTAYECRLIRNDLGDDGFCSYGERKYKNDFKE